MRVSLITTGDMEFLALPQALGRLFPGQEFYAEPYQPNRPFHGFTANKVGALHPTDPPGIATMLLRAALGTLIPSDPRGAASDLACVLEDLELVNKGNEATLIEHVRASAHRVLGARW